MLGVGSGNEALYYVPYTLPTYYQYTSWGGGFRWVFPDTTLHTPPLSKLLAEGGVQMSKKFKRRVDYIKG